MKVRSLLMPMLILILWPACCPARVTPHIPDQLQPWTEWVLYGYEQQQFCTPSHNDAASLQCDWPSELELSVNDSYGEFSQEWLIQADRRLQLPGDDDHWPDGVTIDGKPALVLSENGRPVIAAGIGHHTVTGRIPWDRVPEYLQIPSHTGIIRATVRDNPLEFPNLDAEGRLWLQTTTKGEERIENRLALQSFRLFEDLIPLSETVQIHLDVSGSSREIVLGPVLATEKTIPVSLESQLPARLEPDGRLRVQVRPGQWRLNLTTRHLGPVFTLRYSRPPDDFWPDEEIWSFLPHPELRVVELAGLSAIDPLQTSLPDHWRNYPAYRIKDGETLSVKEIKRGDPVPAPDQLTLQRNIWLRFDGSGYTLQDTITGTKNTDWRLEMNPPTALGRVAVDGVEQFITKRDGSEKSGVEVRRGHLNLTADSVYDKGIASLPATGWDHDFQQVSARLFLPPGWRLLNGAGADAVSGTWIKSWTLLDLFIVLIFTVAVARLFNISLALLAFATMALVYQEPGAPRWIWLALLLGIALLRHVPPGRFRTVVRLVQLANVLLLIGIAVPFSVQQLRQGFYPQLEKPWQSMQALPVARQDMPAPADQIPVAPPTETMQAQSDQAVEMMKEEEYALKSFVAKPKSSFPLSAEKRFPASEQKIAQYDPSMVNQTGPGLPGWQWNTFTLTWTGPVQRDQTLSFLFIGPTTNLVLALLRVALMLLLVIGLLDLRRFRETGLPGLPWRLPLLMILLPLLLAVPRLSQAAEIPSPEMFEELRQRLLAPDECFPGCADIPAMELRITPEEMLITLRISTQTAVSIPLPGNAQHWVPGEILVDGQPATGLFRTDDELWLLMPAGEHQAVLRGRLPRQNSVQLPLPLRPHRVTVKTEGWTVEGVKENGVPDRQLQFRRVAADNAPKDQILETGILPPFLLVQRTLRLGLTWQVETTVQRVSPAGAAVVFAYPLLPGESIVTEDIQVSDGRAQLTLDARQSSLSFESILERSGTITLNHPDTNLWTEEWRVDVSPIFHMETEGIPVILHQQGDRWYPTWHPWPGEEVRLTLSRPPGIAGQSITIDKSVMETRPGRRATDTTLRLSIRSSQGTQHSISLPDTAQLQQVAIDGQIQPIRQEGRRVPLPLRPGLQDIEIEWREPSGIAHLHRTPAVDLGMDSVNSHVDLHLSGNRWPLLVAGPVMGPAVLFWSTVIILLLISFGLAKSGLTGLKFHQWFLLGIGMSQSNMGAGLLVAGWIIAVHLRNRVKPDLDRTTYNLMQAGLLLLTVLALAALVGAISMGLLGHPDMNIIGNGSSSGLLRWYQDHSAPVLPRAWVLSIPMFVYRIAMLAWALWISFSLINLLRLAWHNCSQPVLWQKIPKKTKPTDDNVAAPSSGNIQE